MYKVKNNLSPKYTCDLFNINNCIHDLQVKEFYVPRFKTVTFGKHLVKYLGPTLWSKISPDIRKLSSLDAFKKTIRKVDVDKFLNNPCKKLYIM